jgi:hypothetical protein
MLSCCRNQLGVLVTLGLGDLILVLGITHMPVFALFALLVPVAALIVFRPTWGLYFLALTVPLESVLYLDMGGFRWRPYEVVLGALLVAMVIRRRPPPVDAITLASFLYVAAGLLSLNVSLSPKDSLLIILFEFIMALILFAVRWATRDLATVKNLLLFYVLGVGNAIGLVGLAQFVGYYLGFHVMYFHPEAYAIFRPYATFFEPNPYGNFAVAIVMLSLVLAASPAYAHWRPVFATTAILQLVILALNLSRGPWLGFVAATALYVVLDGLKHRHVGRPVIRLMGVGVLLLGLLVAISFVSPRGYAALSERIGVTINPWGEGAARVRLADIELSENAWRIHPIFGNGVGTWGRFAYGLSGREARVPPRNIFVSWLFEKGIVGTAIAIWLYGAIGWHALRRYFATPDVLRGTLIVAGLVAGAAIFTTFLFTRADISPHYWFMLGLLLAAANAPDHLVSSNAHRD